MSVLMRMLRYWGRLLQNPSWSRVLIYGYEEYHSTQALAGALMFFDGKGRGVAQSMLPLYIVSADIRQAFDTITVLLIIQAFAFWGVPASLSKAIVAELFALDASVRFQGMSTDN